MSETKKPSSLKKLTSGSTWVSPFRTAGGEKKNLRQQLTEENSIKKISVPKKFAAHPTLEAEKKKKKEEELAAAKAKKEAEEKAAADAAEASETKSETGEDKAEAEADETEEAPETESKAAEPEQIASDSSVKSLKDHSIDTPAELAGAETEAETKVEAAEEPAETEPVTEVTETAAEPSANDDDIVEQVKTTPIEIVTQPELKYAPTEALNEKTLEDFNDKPLLLARYNELNAAAIGSVSRSIDDPQKVIDLGSGLKMTQQQLLAIAATRVAPVLANINDEVSKTRSEDEIKRQQDLSSKVASHEKKLQGEFDKHVKKIGKQQDKFDKEIEEKLNNLTRLVANSDKTAADFSTLTKGEIETANTEFDQRETAAVEKHTTDKETLLKNHEELEATKKQELEDSKANQEKTTSEIEELQEKKSTLDDDNSDLSSKIEELTAKYNAKFEELEALKGNHADKEASISKNLAANQEIQTKLAASKADLETKKSKHYGLAAEVGLLTGAVAAYAARLATLKSEKEQVPDRLSKAKEHHSSWVTERQEEAKKIALDHERQRALAIEEEETKRVKAQEEAETKRVELELERQRLKEEEEFRKEEARIAAEKKEEEDRIAAEKKAEEDKIAAEKKAEEDKIAAEKKEEEDRIAAVKKEKEDEEERIRIQQQPEFQRQQRANAREEEKQRLFAEREEKERIYQERKQQEEEEARQLESDIIALNQQKDLKAQEAREEAERLAQVKLDEIERLKLEHEERLKLYQERLDFEELQKTRLLEEVENLKRIRELREEKARLALEVNRDVRLEDIQKLISDRENEVARLSKQIELDDQDLYREHKKESQTSSSFVPVPTIKASDNSPVSALESKERASKETTTSTKVSSAPALSATAAVAATAGAVGAVAATTGSTPKAQAPSNGFETKQRSGSITKSIKRLSQKLKSPSSPTKKEALPATEAKNGAAKEKPAAVRDITPKESIDLKKQPPLLKAQASRADDDSLVVYEEVSDDEFEKNKDHPDYLEISQEDYEKAQQALAKARAKTNGN